MDEVPFVELREIYALFGYKNYSSAIRASQRGQFPIPTYKIGNRMMVDREVVEMYFEEHRIIALTHALTKLKAKQKDRQDRIDRARKKTVLDRRKHRKRLKEEALAEALKNQEAYTDDDGSEYADTRDIQYGDPDIKS